MILTPANFHETMNVWKYHAKPIKAPLTLIGGVWHTIVGATKTKPAGKEIYHFLKNEAGITHAYPGFVSGVEREQFLNKYRASLRIESQPAY